MLIRSNVPNESTWKHETTFASWDEWDKQFQLAKGSLHELREMKGKITENPEILVRWFELYEIHAVRCYELQGFVSWAGNVDSSDAEANSRQGLVAGLLADFQATVSFAEPDLIAKGKELLDWARQEPRLEKFTHYLSNLLRLQQHTRSAEVEEVLGMADDPFDMVYRAYSELTNSDLKFEDAEDPTAEIKRKMAENKRKLEQRIRQLEQGIAYLTELFNDVQDLKERTGVNQEERRAFQQEQAEIAEDIADGDFFGMRSYDQAIFKLYESGEITFEAAASHAASAQEFKAAAQGRRLERVAP